VRASFGEDLVDLVLIGSGAPPALASGVDLLLGAFECGQDAHQPDRP
jgi:hypothetical protein